MPLGWIGPVGDVPPCRSDEFGKHMQATGVSEINGIRGRAVVSCLLESERFFPSANINCDARDTPASAGCNFGAESFGYGTESLGPASGRSCKCSIAIPRRNDCLVYI